MVRIVCNEAARLLIDWILDRDARAK